METLQSAGSVDVSLNRGATDYEPIRFGVPFPIGQIRELPDHCRLINRNCSLPCQCQPLNHWPDGSLKWARIDCILTPEVGVESSDWSVHWETQKPSLEADPSWSITGSKTGADLRDTFDSTIWQRDALLSAERWVLVDAKMSRHAIQWQGSPEVECSGDVCTSLLQFGRVIGMPGMSIEVEWTHYPAIDSVRCDVTLHNQRRAKHRGGLWDLGDSGSHLISDFSFHLPTTDFLNEAVDGASVVTMRLCPESTPYSDATKCSVYQDSSGGPNWQGRNHLNRNGKVSTHFCGFRADVGDQTVEGKRALPIVSLVNKNVRLDVTVPEFWQQFPKALSIANAEVTVGLFPQQANEPHELQGGERKRHCFWIRVSDAMPSSSQDEAGSDSVPLSWVHRPSVVLASHKVCEAAKVVASLIPVEKGFAFASFSTLVQELLEGPGGVVDLREGQDEYGWRHFGDTVADHERVHYSGKEEFVSHYNNQFDVLLGFLYQYLRTTDRRWFELADALARHVIDIDIYHTKEDRAVYNGGLFWFTDHYLTAHTSTHRTYSKFNKPTRGPYGGGPGPEHDFTEGLLLYYQLTGCRRARDAVLTLADWVLAMEEGHRNVFGILDDGLTGKATLGYSKPSRGGANSISVLVDAWTLTHEQKYAELCEQLILRCIHPDDDVEGMDLLDAERNWSYTMFLRSLDKYLKAKEDAGQIDHAYYYARQSLLRYATWMVEHERPYFDQRDRLEFPTEAWPAQELRKANVLRYAARFANDDLARRMQKRGEELADRAWSDLMSFTETRSTIRAMALVMTEGLQDCVLRGSSSGSSKIPTKQLTFKPRETFLDQRRRVVDRARSPRGAVQLVARAADPRRWIRWRSTIKQMRLAR